MYKLDEVIGTEDAELVRRVIERKFNGVLHWTTRQFIVTLLNDWPLNGLWNVRAWRQTPEAGENHQYVSLTVGNAPEIHVWSVGKGWL